MFKDIFFTEHLRATASAFLSHYWKQLSNYEMCKYMKICLISLNISAHMNIFSSSIGKFKKKNFPHCIHDFSNVSAIIME